MASRGKITDLFDVPGIKDQYDQVMGFVKAYVKDVEEASAIRLKVEDSKTIREKTQVLNDLAAAVKKYQDTTDKTVSSQEKLVEITANVDKQNKSLADSQKKVNDTIKDTIATNKTAEESYKDLLSLAVDNELAQKQLAQSKRDLTKEYKSGNISLEDFKQKSIEIKDAQAQLVVQGRDLTTSIRNFAKESQSAEGSLDNMKARLAILQQVYSKLTDEVKKSDIGKIVAKEAEDLSDAINKQKKSMGDFTSNVGRYAESLGDGFELVRREIVRLKAEAKTFEFNGDMRGVEAAGRQIKDLDNIVKIGLDRNATYTQTLRGIDNGYKNMVASGEFSKEFLDQFGKFVAQSKHQSDELTKSIKAIGSETRGLDLATGAISTLASVYQTAAGASELFGKNNQNTEKSIRRLVAIQSVANGIREVAKQLTEKETIAGKAYAAVQSQIAIITDVAASRTQKFNAILKLSGIGLLVTGVTFLISKIASLTDNTEEVTEAQKNFADSIDEANSAIQKQIDLISGDYDETLTKLKDQLNLAEKSGASQVQIFALKKKLAAEEKKLADEQLTAQDQLVQGNDNIQLSGKKGVDALIVAQNYYLDQVRYFNSNIKSLELERAKAIKDGQKDYQKNVEDRIDTQKAWLKSTESTYSNIKTTIEKSHNAEQKILENGTDEAKFNADERRKLVLETTRIEAEANINKNERILNNEKSTLQQRIKAEADNLRERIRIAKAERDAVITDPSKQGSVDIPIAIKKFNSAKELATADSEKKQEKIREDFRLRDLQAVTEHANRLLQIYSEINSELASNEKLSLDDRLKAQERFVKAQTEIANNEFRLRLQQAGVSDEEIAQLEKDRNYKIQSSKLTAEEIENIQVDHETKLLKITSDGASAINSVLSAEIEKQRSIRETSIHDLERIAQSADFSNTKQYSDEIIALNNALRQKKIDISQYQADRLKIENRFNAQSIKNLLDSLKLRLDLIDKYSPAQTEIDAEHRLQAAKALSNRESDDNEKKLLAEKVDRLQKEYDAAKAVNDQKIQLESEYYDAVLQYSDLIKENDEEVKQSRLNSLKEYLTTFTAVLNNTFQIFSELQGIGYDRETAAIDAATAALERKKEKDTEVAEQTITNEEEKQRAISKINARAAQEQAAIDERKRQAERKKAIFDKEANIADIITRTALAVVTTLADNTIQPGFLRIPLAITVGALGAAQLARAISAPLPKFFKGKNLDRLDDYEGHAWVDDGPSGRGGAPETIIREDGTEEKGGNKPRIVWVNKEDIIVPAGRKIKEEPLTAAKKVEQHVIQAKTVERPVRRMITVPDSKVINHYAIAAIHRSNDRQATQTPVPVYDDSGVIKAINKMGKSITRTIQDKTELNMNVTEQGIAAMYQHGSNTTKYFNDQTNWNK